MRVLPFTMVRPSTMNVGIEWTPICLSIWVAAAISASPCKIQDSVFSFECFAVPRVSR